MMGVSTPFLWMRIYGVMGLAIFGICLLVLTKGPRKRALFVAAALLSSSMLCNLLACAPGVLAWAEEQSPGKCVATIHLGIENPGVQIATFDRERGICPDPYILHVTTPDRGFTLESLRQLRGLVHIDDGREALRFVRFRTTRDYCYNWHGDVTPQEIVSFSQASEPIYADTGATSALRLESGRYGVLSDRAYQAGNFQPPVVTEMDGGYRIVRWVCVYRWLKEASVQQWQEDVTPSGGYHRVVLGSIPPPKLPDTEWFIYGLK